MEGVRKSVLVVHDALNTMTNILESLRADYAVREVGDAFETLEALAEDRYACIVCRVSEAIRAQAFCRLVDDSARPPLVFVVGTNVFIDDMAYLRKKGAHCFIEGSGPIEIASLLRAMSAPR